VSGAASQIAILSGRDSTSKYASLGAFDDQNSLTWSDRVQCRLGKYREVEAALAGGVAVDTRHGPKNDTLLLVCAMNGQKRLAKLLLRNKADINAVNEEGNSALHLTFALNYRELGDYLISKGAQEHLRNKKGNTCHMIEHLGPAGL
jgi:ankyrin repeat protein